MNTRQFAQQTQISNFSSFRNKFSGFLLTVLALLAVGILSGNLAQAGNILINPVLKRWQPWFRHPTTRLDRQAPVAPGILTPTLKPIPVIITTKFGGHIMATLTFNLSIRTIVHCQLQPIKRDGWMKTSTNNAQGTSDILWSGDDADYAWLEVSFRDASGNILALYKSDQFSDTLSTSGFPYEAGPWYDFPVTNICQTTPPFAIMAPQICWSLQRER